MNREVHVRFWESPEVKVLRATRQSHRFDGACLISAYHPLAEVQQTSWHFAFVPKREISPPLSR